MKSSSFHFVFIDYTMCTSVRYFLIKDAITSWEFTLRDAFSRQGRRGESSNSLGSSSKWINNWIVWTKHCYRTSTFILWEKEVSIVSKGRGHKWFCFHINKWMWYVIFVQTHVAPGCSHACYIVNSKRRQLETMYRIECVIYVKYIAYNPLCTVKVTACNVVHRE